MSDDASRYTAKRIVPPFLFGSKHAILFQMALIPLTMSRYTIASLSTSKLNYYLPLNKSQRIHIYLGYTMIALSFLALFVFFAYLGLLCNDGEDDACAALTSEIMITGIIICGLTVSCWYPVSKVHISCNVTMCAHISTHSTDHLYRVSCLARLTIVMVLLSHMRSSIESITSSWLCTR